MCEGDGDGNGSKIRGRRAKVAGTCGIADGKFQPSGVARDLSP
jgi:hypothetical protein